MRYYDFAYAASPEIHCLFKEEVEKVSQIGEDSGDAWIPQYLAVHYGRILSDLVWVSGSVDKSARILEVGSQPPVLARCLWRLGFEQVVVSDYDPDSLSPYLMPGLNSECIDLTSSRFLSDCDRYDAILFFEVFEHLRVNLISLICQLANLLSGEGKVYMTTPNVRSLKGRYNFLIKGVVGSTASDLVKQYQKELDGEFMGHVREYTSKEVIGLYTHCGFRLADVYYRGRMRRLVGDRILFRIWPSLAPYMGFIFTKP